MNKMDKFKLVALMEKNGYVFGNEVLPKLVGCFYEAGLRTDGMVPAALLSGLPGAGKTYLAECFASAIDAEVIFYQITEDTNASVLVGDINPAEVVGGNASTCISDGALIKAAKAEKPVVLILDECDKGPAESDAFLLDFLQSRRIRDLNGEMQYLHDSEVWVFMTSNDDRNISDALSRRVRKWEIDKLPIERVTELLEIETDNQLLILWEGIPELSLSQLESYIQDMGGPECVYGDIDTSVLGQYINIPEELTLKPKTSGGVVINVSVRARTEYWDLEEALMEHPIRNKYGIDDEYHTLTFQMSNVVDWLRFGSNLRTMVRNDDQFTVEAEIVEDGDHRGAYVPLEVLPELVKRCETYENRVAIVTKGGKLSIGEVVGELVHFEQADITDLFKGG